MHVVSIKMKNGENVIGELMDVLDTHYVINLPVKLHVVLGGEEMMFQSYHQPSFYYPYGTTTYVEIPKEDIMIVDAANEYYQLLYETTVRNLIALEQQRYSVLKKLLGKQPQEENLDEIPGEHVESKRAETPKQSIRDTEAFQNDIRKIAESNDDLYGHFVNDDGDLSFIVPGTDTKQ
ncbi:hypothetical protein [Synechococcus phage BUCT-ZZ01]|nr:hypothetical protein [Synechococcus phage BUCT-ZZ01]